MFGVLYLDFVTLELADRIWCRVEGSFCHVEIEKKDQVTSLGMILRQFFILILDVQVSHRRLDPSFRIL